MGSLWRSQPMQLVQLYVQIEAAHDTIDELGNLGLIEFRDLNPDVNAFQRNFVNEVKRYDELERKLRFFGNTIAHEKGLGNSLKQIAISGPAIHPVGSVDELEAHLEDTEREVKQMNESQLQLDKNFNELQEWQHVLSADAQFFQESGGRDEDPRAPLLSDGGESGAGGKSVKIGFITGVIVRSKLAAFERVLWRSTRGNIFMKQAEIDEPILDPNSGEELDKNVFIIFFHGDRLQSKIKKICESESATIYPCPENRREREDLLKQVGGRLMDLNVVLARTRDHRKSVLTNIANHLVSWNTKVLKEKAIYHTMNMFNYDVGRKCLIAEGWCPMTATEEIQQSLRKASQRSGALVPSILSVISSEDEPPTYFETNKYTRAFQEIVNAYGIAHYREINPAVLAIVTFPFLFAVMFGDFGHGFFLLAFALWMILNEKKLGSGKLNEIMQMPFDGRYVLLLMSFFSLYVGLIYNECFAVPLNIFGSSFHNPPANYSGCATYQNCSTFMDWDGTTYPFGIDPVWKGATNELDYYNSFKMKLAILLGVIQMSVGIILSGLNALNEKAPFSWINFVFVFVPQIIFLWSIFGYMCVLIIMKWVYNYAAHNFQPPYILQVIIGMVLRTPLTEDMTLFSGQNGVQTFLLILALLMVPCMLFPKPFLLKRHYAQHKRGHRLLDEHGDDHGQAAHGGGGGGHGGHGEFEFSEVFIHQIIHTIEFVLGAISNTASYLRLWALSLAHSELATVFWNRILVGQLTGNVLYSFIGFAIWFAGTFAVLLVMESLSAFLHALRLHWVEFQNKFFLGDGHRFAPFSYARLMQADDE